MTRPHSTSLLRAMGATLAGTFAALGPVQAGIVGGTLPGANPLNAVNVAFNDTQTTASLTISGQVNADDSPPTWNFATPDGFWRGQLSLLLDEFVDDELSLSVSLTHTSQPHPEPDGGNGAPFSTSFRIAAEDYPGSGAFRVTSPGATYAHGRHIDTFSEAVFTFNKTWVGLDFDEIVTWNFSLSAIHSPVPEPSLALLFAAGIGLAAAGSLRRPNRG